MEPIDETTAPLTAPDHFVTPLGRSELIGLLVSRRSGIRIALPPFGHIQKPRLGHNEPLRTVNTSPRSIAPQRPSPGLGPLLGHYAGKYFGVGRRKPMQRSKRLIQGGCVDADHPLTTALFQFKQRQIHRAKALLGL